MPWPEYRGHEPVQINKVYFCATEKQPQDKALGHAVSSDLSLITRIDLQLVSARLGIVERI